MTTSPVPPLVTWSLVTVGAFLVYASVRGLSPLGELTATLQGKAAPPRATLGVGPGALYVGPDPGDSGGPTEGGRNTLNMPQVAIPAPPDLVKIGQGGHQLTAAASAAFHAWQGAFGSTIWITDSYRDYTTQLHAWQQDPNRFAPPDRSRHVRGEAVDVNLPKVGADAGRQNGIWKALYASATATGWCNPRGPYNGDHKEPWHFSFNGCG